MKYGIVLTTSHLVAGREIEREVGIVTAVNVVDLGITGAVGRGLKWAFGEPAKGENDPWQKVMEEVLSELRQRAMRLDAEAVISIDLEYQNILTAGQVLVSATGTAVVLKKQGSDGSKPGPDDKL